MVAKLPVDFDIFVLQLNKAVGASSI